MEIIKKFLSNEFTIELEYWVILIILVAIIRIFIYTIKILIRRNEKIEELEKSVLNLKEIIKKKTEKIKNLKEINSHLGKTIYSKEEEILKGGISPHFFKNTMSTINNFAQKTLYSVKCLTPILNHIIYESKEETVPIKEEVDFLKKFIKLQKLGLSPTFRLNVNIDVIEYETFNIIPMLLLDFVENAFKYTDLNDHNSKIDIKLKYTDDHLLIYEVRNTPSGKDRKEKGGYGMDNLRKRLALLYKNEAELIYQKDDNEFFAKLIIPNYKINE